MAKNFMEASTEISSYISKMDQCLNKIANILAEACVTRGKEGKTTSLEKDIDNAIKGLSYDDQAIVLKKLAVLLTNQCVGGSSNKSSNTSSSSNNIFRSRSF